MKGSWPKVNAQMRFKFFAEHSMPRIGKGCEVPHEHHYTVTFGWTHEIQPMDGYTFELVKQRRLFEALIDRVNGKNLNSILPIQPSAEFIAIWLLAQIEPCFCDHVIIECYEMYTVRVDRSAQRSEWVQFLAGRGPDPFSNHVFKLK